MFTLLSFLGNLLPMPTLTVGQSVVAHPHSVSMLAYRCEFDLGMTYYSRRPELAIQCFEAARTAAIALGRPDLAYDCNEYIGHLRA